MDREELEEFGSSDLQKIENNWESRKAFLSVQHVPSQNCHFVYLPDHFFVPYEYIPHNLTFYITEKDGKKMLWLDETRPTFPTLFLSRTKYDSYSVLRTVNKIPANAEPGKVKTYRLNIPQQIVKHIPALETIKRLTLERVAVKDKPSNYVRWRVILT